MDAKPSLLLSNSFMLALATFLFHWFQSLGVVLTVHPTVGKH